MGRTGEGIVTHQTLTAIPKWMDKEVWYLAHPIATDNRFTYEENLAHVLHMTKLFFDHGLRTVAPYYAMCLVMPDTDPAYREIGLEVDCAVVARMKNMVLCGHKMSRGMTMEYEALLRVDCCTKMISFVGMSDAEIAQRLANLSYQEVK